jgi:L-amino acid N-acyltransferase YncA
MDGMKPTAWTGDTELNRLDWPAFDAAQLERDAPDQHLQLFDGDQLLARASLWFDGPRIEANERSGLIGHYAASSLEAGRTILESACGLLRASGCARVIGPMDGSTWKSYRLVSEMASALDSELRSEPPYLLETQNPLEWNQHFLASGFEVLATYHSTLGEQPAPDPRMPAVRKRFAANRITTRAAIPTNLESELEAIYDLALESFSQNFLYSPISKSDFLGLYRPALAKLPPGFTRIAEHDGRTVGFAFAVPDLLRAQMDTLILKTVGIRKARIYAGLGALLADEMHDLARSAGMSRVIHALIHDGNVSGKTSAKTGGIMRRYALYSKPL